MEDLTELLKGVLEGCVLHILSQGGSYGYEIVRALNQAGFTSVSEGTVYPILVRLEAKSLVEAARVRSQTGPPRKVYTLNQQGHAALEAFWRRWDFVSSRLAHMKEERNA
ncbi:MAG: PadR family transcriptional regulator [Bifidobacteriaceae bacterium]|jgi:DNA-binding PadR family transcriptional regulator|nr:PadR family transcriptional regulator [Bifidobacteriaceae bacterium]